MNTEWSLDALYKGYQDKSFTDDLKKLEDLIKQIKDFIKNLSHMAPEDGILKAVAYFEEYGILSHKLSAYVQLRLSTNTTDGETNTLMSKIEELTSSLSKEFAVFKKYAASLENLSSIIRMNPELKDYEFFFTEAVMGARYALSDEAEEILAKINLSAGSAWSTMQQYLTSTLVVDYKDSKTTLSGIRNLAYSEDAAVRKEAYEAELAAYDKIKDAVAFSLNHLKSLSNTVADLRGYESPLDMTLFQSRMSKETLDAMYTAIKEYLPKFHAYLRRKAELLGHKNGLPWYDLFAPLGESHKKYTIEEAKEYLLNHFSGFSTDLVDMIRTAFDEGWIDFYPHPGKVGGAFCENLPYIKQSRILTNFDGSLSDIVTLAHELGHAYHGLNIEDHKPLNVDYSMPVAETASTFNETVIMSAAIKEADADEKLGLIESQLQDVTQIICDIYSRFLFESAVFKKRKEAFLFPKDLEELMVKTQLEAYGNGLDPDKLNPFMWVCKSHYYIDSLNFYNFPYSFGGLFARGLYAQYKEEGEAFVPKYKALLKATTINTVEEVAKMADINLTTPDFWRQSLAIIAEDIDLFLELSKDKI